MNLNPTGLRKVMRKHCQPFASDDQRLEESIDVARPERRVPRPPRRSKRLRKKPSGEASYNAPKKKCHAGVFEDATLFRHAMKVEHNFQIYDVPMDGDCLFSSISHQVYGDICFSGLVRDRCCNYMKLFEGKFMLFIDTRRFVANRRDENYVDFDDYLVKMRTPGIWGGNLEITALSELYQRPVEIYDQQTTPRATFSNSVNFGNDLPPMRMALKNGNHYDSVVSQNHSETLLNMDEAGQFEDSVLASLRD